MTNSSRSSALEPTLVAALGSLLLCGCGEPTPPKPLTADDFVDEAASRLALGQLDAAASAVSNAWLLAAEDVDVRLLKAQIDFHAGDSESATRLYRGVAEDDSLDRKVRAQGWAGLGVVDLCSNARDAARLDLLRALRLDGKNAAAWYNLGCVYRDGFSFYAAACDCFETYVRLETNDVERVKRVQHNYIRNLREERANAILEIPGARNVNAAACSKALQAAEAAEKKRTFKTAKLRYEEAVAADPTSFKATVGLARSWLRTDPTAAGRTKALDFYYRAYTLSPSSVSTLIEAGNLAYSSGNVLRAVKFYSSAMAADPTNTTAIDGLIRSLRKNSQKPTADAYQGYRDFLKRKFR